jgi:hypothetical protein
MLLEDGGKVGLGYVVCKGTVAEDQVKGDILK